MDTIILDNSEIETVIIKISEFPESSRKWDDITDKPAVIAAGDTIQEALEQVGLENVPTDIASLQEVTTILNEDVTDIKAEQITQNEAISLRATKEYVDDEIGNVVEYVNQGDQTNANAITAENQRATTAEQNISNNLATETTNRVAGDLTNANAIVAETNRAIAAEALKADKINIPPTPSNVLDINKIQRSGDVISNIIDQYTGEPITATKVIGTPTVDNIIYFQIGSEYFKRNFDDINVKWFGAKGDGITDDTLTIRKAIDFSVNQKLIIPDGTYIVNVTNINSYAFLVPSNSYIDISPFATIKLTSTNKVSFQVFCITNASNVTINGGNLIGERNTHIGSTGEDGHGILVGLYSNNIKISNIKVSNFWGDGIVLAALSFVDDASTNIIIDNVYSFNNRRQGLSIISAKKVKILNSRFSGTNGTAPSSGIDIEPNENNKVEDVLIDNCTMDNNYGPGLVVYGNHPTSVVSGLVISNCIMDSNRLNALAVGGGGSVTNVKVNNVKLIDGVENTSTVLSIGTGSDFTFSNINILHKGTGVLSVGASNTNNLILQNIYSRSISSSFSGGIGILGTCINVKLINCDVISKDDALKTYIQSGELRTDFLIQGCVFTSTLARAVNLNQHKNLKFINNTINGSAYDGINITASDNCIINENTIKNAAILRNNLDRGIYLFTVTNSVINYNNIRRDVNSGNGIKTAIELSALSKLNTIKDNNVFGYFPLGNILNSSNYFNIIDDYTILKVGSTAQRPSLTDNTIRVGFVYYDETLKTLLNVKGAYETSTITINNSATSSGNIDITLAGVTYNIPILNADSRDAICDKILAFNYDGWIATKSVFTITFVRDIADVVADTVVNSNSTGVVFTLVQSVKGQVRFYDTLNSSNIVIDNTSTPYTKSTINALYPLAKKDFIVRQDAASQTYIKKDDSPTGNWSTFPTVQLT